MRGFPDLPPIWMAGFGALQWGLGQVTPVLGDRSVSAFGTGLIVIGMCLILWSASYFIRHKTPIEPGQTPSHLIATGPYKLSRNPIYLAMAVMLTGWTLWLGVLAGLVLVPIFGFVITRRFIVHEEAALRAEFGLKAEQFFDDTARWIIR